MKTVWFAHCAPISDSNRFHFCSHLVSILLFTFTILHHTPPLTTGFGIAYITVSVTQNVDVYTAWLM